MTAQNTDHFTMLHDSLGGMQLWPDERQALQRVSLLDAKTVELVSELFERAYATVEPGVEHYKHDWIG